MIHYTDTSLLLFYCIRPCSVPSKGSTGHCYQLVWKQLPDLSGSPIPLHSSPPSVDIWHTRVCLLALDKCINKILALNFFTELCGWQLRVNLGACLFQLLHVDKSICLQPLSTHKPWLPPGCVVKHAQPLFQSFLQNYSLSAYMPVTWWSRKCLLIPSQGTEKGNYCTTQ